MTETPTINKALIKRARNLAKRFLERLENPEKNWKFSASDVKERRFWNDHMKAYEDMIRHIGTKDAPWYVVPADNKWFPPHRGRCHRGAGFARSRISEGRQREIEGVGCGEASVARQQMVTTARA